LEIEVLCLLHGSFLIGSFYTETNWSQEKCFEVASGTLARTSSKNPYFTMTYVEKARGIMQESGNIGKNT
jgi:hypothetical protein